MILFLQIILYKMYVKKANKQNIIHSSVLVDENRFLVGDKHEYTFLPFGLGPRHCIGMRLAQLEMRMAAVRLLMKFKFISCEKTVSNSI